MISYLIYSTLCLSLVLLFYHILLAGEKIYQINRFYLLTGLLFSLTIPFIPVGVADSLMNLDPELQLQQFVTSGSENLKTESTLNLHADSPERNDEMTTSDSAWVYPLLLCLYGTFSLLLFMRMIRHLYRMHLRTGRNPASYIRGYKVVLLNEDIVPHTFWKTIFVNRKQYENGEIREEVLLHELTHARQNHSVDILIVEILKAIFWLNPVLYFYKTAIQLNHEFIADDKVLSEKADIADYQALLLRTRTAKTVHYLSTTLNFKVTKKRFKMMTKTSSTYSTSLKAAAIIPFLLMLGITFGCEPAGMEEDNQTKNVTLELVNSETIKLNGESLSISEFEANFIDLPIDPENTTIHFKVHSNTSFGIVTDIQEILRERGTLRVNYSTVQSSDSQTDRVQGTRLQKRNIMEIYINEEGDFIVNENQVSHSSLKKLVKEFVTNEEKNDHLSESPENAIITLRTDKRTPYDAYNNALGQVTVAYDELREEASMEVFGQSFQSLEAGSEEKKQIEKMYPRKISIKEPSGS